MKKIYDRISAGGLVYKKNHSVIYFVLCYKNKTNRWHLPKETQEFNESICNTAIREVKEETGLEVKIKVFLSNIYYKFIDNQNNMLNKKVAFYIMEAIDGSFKNHDKEFDKIIWANSNEAIKLLKYTNEKKLVTKATLLV
jgi:8-oxo-dGTP pyrophosphatase MutT (NUDIX family)